jgi:hypothetical protein
MTFLFACCITASAMAGGAVDSLLATDPEVAAEHAFAVGDRRHIVVPMCGNLRGEVLPGWPLEGSPQHEEAINNGNRPVTCKDLGDRAESKKFLQITKYAERYNRRLLKLSKRSGQ